VNQYSLFWLGLLVAIPLSILANLLTPNIRRFLLRWNETRRTAYEQKLAAEQATITRILSHPFRFYRFLLRLIYVHVVLLTLFFILYWMLSTAPGLLTFAYRITGKPPDAKAFAQFIDGIAAVHGVLAYFFACLFMLVLVKTFRVAKRVIDASRDKV
jgi:hypothetical protein